MIGPLLYAFIVNVINKILSWVLVWSLRGALKTFVIFATLLASLALAVYGLIDYLRETLIQALTAMGGHSPALMSMFASFLPPSFHICVSIIVSTYVTLVVYNITKEIIKLKARWARKALGTFTA